ncbi:uncharacterized protein TNCV_4847131 [Trichonephila clavipes]|nr:uncharacterized protein TNCV_4847131 [Trichonephila clavipes]
MDGTISCNPLLLYKDISVSILQIKLRFISGKNLNPFTFPELQASKFAFQQTPTLSTLATLHVESVVQSELEYLTRTTTTSDISSMPPIFAKLTSRLPKWEAKTRHGVSFVPALLKTLEVNLKQQPVYQDSLKDALSDLSLEIELVIPFAPNQDPQDIPQ